MDYKLLESLPLIFVLSVLDHLIRCCRKFVSGIADVHHTNATYSAILEIGSVNYAVQKVLLSYPRHHRTRVDGERELPSDRHVREQRPLCIAIHDRPQHRRLQLDRVASWRLPVAPRTAAVLLPDRGGLVPGYAGNVALVLSFRGGSVADYEERL